MNLMLFGATGGTGAQVLGQALDAGHRVTAVVRDPGSLAQREHHALTVLTGDVLDPGRWHTAVAGHDAVVSCLGSTDRRHPTAVYSQGARNILEAMHEGEVHRFLCLSSAGLEIAPGTPFAQRLVTRLLIQRLYRHGYADMARMESEVAASEAQWTIVRPPMLTDGPLTAAYRTAANAHLDKAQSLSRADLAHYLLTHLDDAESWRTTVEIAN